MPVKDSIFGSDSEKRGFHSLEQTWGEKYRVCPQVPMSAVFTPKDNWRDTSNFFFKTSFDYVLCTREEGRFLLAIDFDGMGQGFDSYDERYVQVEPTKDKDRKSKFDFKIQYARDNNFPYYIVASKEIDFLDDETKLTVLDSIIGSEVAGQRFSMLAKERTFESEDEVFDLEMECIIECNPIVRKHRDIMVQVFDIIGEPKGFASSYSPIDSTLLSEYEIGLVGILFNTPIGEVSDTFRMRCTTHSYVLFDIVEMLVWNKLLRMLQRPL